MIIGLLIGGILVAQSMISTAKITGQVRQFQQFDIAMTNFKTKFSSLPGDIPSFTLGTDAAAGGGSLWGDTFNGNGDGIMNECTNIPSRWDGRCEFSNVWLQLVSTEMLRSNYTYRSYIKVTDFNIYAGLHFPLGIIMPNGTKIGTLAYGIPANGKNYYDMTVYVQNGTYTPSSSVTPMDLLTLDKKMDDGVGNTGTVVARGTSWLGMTNPALAGAGNCVTASGSYNTSAATVNGINCIPRIEMFGQTGNSQ